MATVIMKTNIDVLDNPNSDKNIQAQLVKSAILQHEKRIREWANSPKRETRSVQTMIREYAGRLQTLKEAAGVKSGQAHMRHL